MNMPPKDNRNTPKSNLRSSSSKRRSILIRIVLPIAVALIGVTLLATFGFHLVNISFGGTSVQERPISKILDMAEAHQLASVQLSGNRGAATGSNGEESHATREARP